MVLLSSDFKRSKKTKNNYREIVSFIGWVDSLFAGVKLKTTAHFDKLQIWNEKKNKYSNEQFNPLLFRLKICVVNMFFLYSGRTKAIFFRATVKSTETVYLEYCIVSPTHIRARYDNYTQSYMTNLISLYWKIYKYLYMRVLYSIYFVLYCIEWFNVW